MRGRVRGRGVYTVVGTVTVPGFLRHFSDEDCSLNGQTSPLLDSIPNIVFIYTELIASTLKNRLQNPIANSINHFVL